MKTFRSIVAVALVLVTALVAVSCGENKDVPKGMQLVESEFVDCKFYVPATWTADKTSGFLSAYVPDDKSNVSLMTMTATRAYKDIGEYIEEYLTELKNTYVGFEYIEAESLVPTAEKPETGLTLGGKDAARLVYKIKVNDVIYKYMQVITASGFYIYTLTYTALVDKYDSHIEDVSKIITEFKF